MINRTATLTLALLAVLAAGCSNLGSQAGNPRFFTPGDAARVVILEEVALQPRELRAFFQDGRQVSRRDVNPHHPNCNLELGTRSREARSVPPGSYAITRTVRRHAPLASMAPVQVASLELPLLAQVRPSTVNYQTQLFLTPVEGGSDDVRALNCSRWGDPGGISLFPTPEEIATALGALGRLDL